MPGRAADDYRPFGAGKLIPAGSDISIQVHYTPIGKEIVDRPLIGFTVADKAPAKRWVSFGIVGGGPDFAIPPNEPNYKSPPFDLTFTAEVELVEFMPHMHVRGKNMTYHLVYPDGRDQIVLNVPKYDFNWQLLYQPAKPIRVPKGTRMYVDAHYDNSTANRLNPNPNRTVYLGQDDVGRDDGAVLRRAHRLERRSERRDQARSLRGAGRRCVMRRAVWMGGLIALLAASTFVVSAQVGGKPVKGGNPTPGTAQPDPPNVSDRITVSGCLQPASKSNANSETPDANTPSDARFLLSSAQRVDGCRRDRRLGALSASTSSRSVSTRGDRQSVLAVCEHEGRDLGQRSNRRRQAEPQQRPDSARRVRSEDRIHLSVAQPFSLPPPEVRVIGREAIIEAGEKTRAELPICRDGGCWHSRCSSIVSAGEQEDTRRRS